MEDRIKDICFIIQKFGNDFDLSDEKTLRTILAAKNRISAYRISTLNKNEVFVFGSDTVGHHNGRASKQAHKDFGAKERIVNQLQGQSYAIPTTDERKKRLTIGEITQYVDRFLSSAKEHTDKKFLVTRLGCGFSGYDDSDISKLFTKALALDNVYLPQSFIDELFETKGNFKNPSQLVPSNSKGITNFRDELASQFGLYYLWLRKNLINNKYWDTLSITDPLEIIFSGIINAVDMSLRGLPAAAYNELANVLNTQLLQKPEDEKKLMAWDPGFKTIETNKSFYRMRNEPDNLVKKNVDRRGMFHIGFSLRGKVKTQRYSVPGYPCLYLGEHIFGCWEENGRPNLNNCLISRLVNTKGFKVLDLRIPEESAWNHSNLSVLRKTILTFPFVIASTFIQSDIQATFKPEYIIPQLLLQYVKELAFEQNELREDQERVVYGIRYTSVHKPKAGGNRINYFCTSETAYDNYVIPVVDIKHEHCSHLSQMFKITEPICEEFEKGKKQISSQEIFENDKTESNYEINDKDDSIFETLEKILENDKLLDFITID